MDESVLKSVLEKAEAERQLHHPGSDYSMGIQFVVTLIKKAVSTERYERRSSIGDDSYF